MVNREQSSVFTHAEEVEEIGGLKPLWIQNELTRVAWKLLRFLEGMDLTSIISSGIR